MKDKKKRVIILVFVLLLSVGIALAYFVGRTLFQGNGAKTKVTTASINGATITVEGDLEFNAEGMLPGHKEMSRIKVTAVGDNVLLPFNLIWTGTNGLNTPLNITVYKSASKYEVNTTCSTKKENVSNGQKVYEECEIENKDKLGNIISTGIIEGQTTEESVMIAEDEFINATTEPGTEMYYYIEVEYPNLDSVQNPDMGGEFRGNINAEASDAEPDINILAVYTEQDDGTYKETKDIPKLTDGYLLNTTKSTCNNEAKPIWNEKDWNLTIDNLTKSGTSCYLYFGKKPTGDSTLAKWGLSEYANDEITSFTGTSCLTGCKVSENGIYKTEDNDGTSYYFRGTVTNNWIKFGENDAGTQDVWWRIVRINGDGTIRLIYSGMFDKNSKPSNPNFETGAGTLVATSQPFTSSSLYNDNTYVGFYYGTTGGSYPTNHSNATASNVANQLKTWYQGADWDADKYGQYIDEDAGFCNDRTKPNSGTHGNDYTQEGYGNKPTVYGPSHRLTQTGTTGYASSTQEPTLKCGELTSGWGVDEDAYKRDLYTLKKEKRTQTKEVTKGNGVLEVPVGLITSDEVVFAGGFAVQKNTGYYLYNNQNFWTMSPWGLSGSALVFNVYDDGGLKTNNVGATYGVRPVINLKADTKFTFPSGDRADTGTIDNPYVVSTS